MIVVWITPNSGYVISYIVHQVEPDINTENKHVKTAVTESIYLSICLSIFISTLNQLKSASKFFSDLTSLQSFFFLSFSFFLSFFILKMIGEF